jgi:hypothetical protein
MRAAVCSVRICLRATTRGQLMAHIECGGLNRKSTILHQIKNIQTVNLNENLVN